MVISCAALQHQFSKITAYKKLSVSRGERSLQSIGLLLAFIMFNLLHHSHYFLSDFLEIDKEEYTEYLNYKSADPFFYTN